MKIKVSVVVPVYNVEKYIRECIDSILNQTLKEEELEIILVDDGSKDNSGEILDLYASEDKRITVIHKQNEGVSAARNDGISLCNGEYIYIMDSDDYLEPDALQVMYDNIIETNADVVITDHYTFREDNIQQETHLMSKEFLTEDKDIIQQLQYMTLHLGYSPYLTDENTGLSIAPPWTKLIKKDLIINNQLFFDSYVQGIFDDGLFTLSVFQYAKRVSYLRTCTYHYRILQTSLIHRYNPNRVKIDKRVFQRIDEFSIKYHKGKDFKEASYARIIIYLVHSFNVYYFNKQYQGSIKENYNEFNDMIKSEPYKTAIKNVDISKLKRIQKFVTMFLRMHLTSLIWFIFRIREQLKK